MSNFKFSPNLFLEVIELDKFKSFLDTDGFRKNILQNTVLFGLIKKSNDLLFANGKIERDLDTSDGQKTIKIRPLEAINNQGLFLSSPLINSLIIPEDGRWYWIKASHKYNTLEVGKVTLSANGDLTGVGTKFTESLRGMPNFPSRIRFSNSQFNNLEYDVLEVIDDEHATIMHPASTGTGVATFEIESDLTYSVVGTFTPGVAVPEGDKYPFQYDSVNYQLIQEDIVNQRPTYIQDQEFYLARVTIQGTDVVIQDKRIEHWETQGRHTSLEIVSNANPLIGVEYIKWQNTLSPSNVNQVFIAWGMRSQNWSVDSSKNIVTLFGSATGGLFKTVDDFTNGDFDGWRIYTANGKYSKVSTSIKQGQAINLTLDVLDVDNYSADGGITFNNSGANAEFVLIVPDAEEITLDCIPDIAINNNTSQSFTFPINTLIANCPLEVYQDPTCLFNITYKYKTDRIYTEARVLPDNTVGYYTEASFYEDGAIKPSDDRVLYPYEGVEGSGYIRLTISPNAYSILVGKVYKGDRIGVQTVNGFITGQVYSLRVGRDKNYQYVIGDLDLTDDIYINLENESAVEGNEFRIHFNLNSIALNGKKIYIVKDYTSGGAPTTIKELSAGDFFQMKNQDGGIVIDCVFSDSSLWNVAYQNYDLGVPFEIKTLDGVINDLFDNTGWGKVKGLFGYYLCDGRNGLNLVEKFILGAGTSGPTTVAVGASAGVKQVTLTIPQLPSHSFTYKRIVQEGKDVLAYDAVGDKEGASYVDTETNTLGNNQPHDNMPPYWALIYAKKSY